MILIVTADQILPGLARFALDDFHGKMRKADAHAFGG